MLIVPWIILILFAIIPGKFWEWLKPYFNWEVFLKTLETGWQKFNQFLKETIGFSFSDFFKALKNFIGIDIPLIFQKVRTFLGNIFEKIAEWLK